MSLLCTYFCAHSRPNFAKFPTQLRCSGNFLRKLVALCGQLSTWLIRKWLFLIWLIDRRTYLCENGSVFFVHKAYRPSKTYVKGLMLTQISPVWTYNPLELRLSLNPRPIFA